MVRTVNAFLMAVCLLFAVEANALSVNQWKGLSLTQQQYYVIGVFDGGYAFRDTILQAQEQTPVITGFTKLVECAAGMEFVQILAIIQKYLENNPAEWHYGMALLVLTALNEACAPKSK